MNEPSSPILRAISPVLLAIRFVHLSDISSEAQICALVAKRHVLDPIPVVGPLRASKEGPVLVEPKKRKLIGWPRTSVAIFDNSVAGIRWYRDILTSYRSRSDIEDPYQEQ